MPDENIPTEQSEQPAQPTTEVAEPVAPPGTVETPTGETSAPTTPNPLLGQEGTNTTRGDDLTPAKTPAVVLETNEPVATKETVETPAVAPVAPSVENGQETPLPAPVADAIENGHDIPLPANSAGTPPLN